MLVVKTVVHDGETERIPKQRIEEVVREHFDLRPGAFRDYLEERKKDGVAG